MFVRVDQTLFDAFDSLDLNRLTRKLENSIRTK